MEMNTGGVCTRQGSETPHFALKSPEAQEEKVTPKKNLFRKTTLK